MIEFTNREINKTPTKRAQILRDFYYNAKSSVSMEFPYWYTRKWNELEGEITIIRRAEALKEAFSHLTPKIFPKELLVMGKTNHMRGSYPMPWLSASYFMAASDKLYEESLNAGKLSADKVSKFGTGGGNVTESAGSVVSIAGKFGLRKEELPILMDLAKKWVGKSVEDIGCKYEKMVPEYDLKESIMKSVICMFDSGYTLPQGREVIDYYYPLQYGIDGLINICKDKIKEVAGSPEMDRLYFYKATQTMLEGIQNWILNYAKEARYLSEIEKDEKQKNEYIEIAEILEWISAKPPQTFRQALQMTFTFHLAVLNEDCISGLSPGRLGQVLYPYYKNDLEKGLISKEKVSELLECMRIKYTELDCFASMGVVGGVLSGNTFNNLSIGGLKKNGGSAANELELLILESGISCATPQPTLSLLYDEKLPEAFKLKAIECNKVGTGYPAWMNNQVAIEFLLKNYGHEGLTVEEARAWAIGGCLETSPGTWHKLELDGKTYLIPGGAAPATSVGVHFISLPKILELVLHNGYDSRTDQQVYKAHDSKLESFDELFSIFKKYFAESVKVLTLCNNIQHDAWRKITPSLVNSMLKPDCLAKGKDIGNKGSRYNTTFNVEICGGVNLVNSLASLKKNIYEEKSFSIDELKNAIKENFGYKKAKETGSFSIFDQVPNENVDKWVKIRKLCLDAPKYGNDEEYVDSIFAAWEEWYCEMCHDFKSIYDEPLYACQISVSTHAPMGAVTLATPDGRLEGTTYADASVSAYPGTDKNGPYALFASACCWDHSNSQNSQLNMKIHPSGVSGQQGAKKLLELTKGYMRKGGFHIQYNIVDSKMLKDAQANPDDYRDLMVRVAGFTQYWVELGKHIQDEIIARTEYESV
ncbi:MAG: 4-hydroxyphenylacetate decarboxylase large subunit [Pseudomonadota bacterium]